MTYPTKKEIKQLALEAYNNLEGGDVDHDLDEGLQSELGEATAAVVHSHGLTEQDDAGQLQNDIGQHLHYVPGHWEFRAVTKKKS